MVAARKRVGCTVRGIHCRPSHDEAGGAACSRPGLGGAFPRLGL